MSNLFTRPQHKAGSLLRGLSAPLWTPSDLEYVRLGGLDRGYGFIDDFTDTDDAWVFTDNTPVGSAATGALDDAKGGVYKISAVSTTDTEGGNLARLGSGSTTGEIFIPNASADIYFETRLKIDGTITSNKVDLFAGLSVSSTAIMVAGNQSANHIGFEHVGEDLNLDFHCEKAGTRSNELAVGTFADGTYLKLGFHVEGVTKVTPYVNGVKKTAITTNIPIVEMVPIFACNSGGTDTPEMHIDWVACYQFEQIDN